VASGRRTSDAAQLTLFAFQNDVHGISIAELVLCRATCGAVIFYGNLESAIKTRRIIMGGNIFYIIGVIVVVLFILGYLGLR
jgi:hypothetical protein